MSKNKKRKRMQATSAPSAPSGGTPSEPSAAATAQQSIMLTADAVATTIDTLQYLAARPELLASKALRELRAALHPIVEHQLKKYDPIDYVSRATVALRGGHGADALLALKGLHARGQQARQGTIQRWVRDCDLITDSELRVRVLHAVLRAGKTVGETACIADGAEAIEPGQAAQALRLPKAADSAEEDDGEASASDGGASGDVTGAADDGARAMKTPGQTTEMVTALPGWLPHDSEADAKSAEAAAATSPQIPREGLYGCPTRLGLRIVMSEAGAVRQPPNHHDLNIYACDPITPILDDTKPPTSTRRVEVPGVPGAFVLLDVLTRAECATLTAVAETIGYTPDHPLSRDAPSGIGGLEWLMHARVMDELTRRCAPHMPPMLSGTDFIGINARCRFFRYTDAERAVYRPHIDGSWPG